MAYARRRPAGLLVLMLVPGFAAALLLGTPVFARDFSNVATFAMATAAGISCLVRAAGRPGRMRWAWTGVGLGALSYAVGEGSWTWTETVQGRPVAFPSLPDIGYLGWVPLIAAG